MKTLKEKATRVLQRVSTWYESIAESMDDEAVVINSDLFRFQYSRLSLIQYKAGDIEGARRTALSLAPYLLTLRSTEPAYTMPPEDLISYQEGLDRIISEQVKLISLNHPQAQKMLSAIGNEGIRNQCVGELIESFGTNLVAAGLAETGFKVMKDEGVIPYKVWELMAEMVDQLKFADAENVLEQLEKYYPEYFIESSSLHALNSTPMSMVLYRLGGNDILKKSFSSLRPDEFEPLWYFAFRLGKDSARETLSDIASYLQLSHSQEQKLWSEYDRGLRSEAVRVQGMMFSL